MKEFHELDHPPFSVGNAIFFPETLKIEFVQGLLALLSVWI